MGLLTIVMYTLYFSFLNTFGPIYEAKLSRETVNGGNAELFTYKYFVLVKTYFMYGIPIFLGILGLVVFKSDIKRLFFKKELNESDQTFSNF